MSLALSLGGHQSIKDYRFDFNKVEKWCNKNNLTLKIDDEMQLVHMSCK